MTLGTLAQPYVRDGGSWKKGNGTNKGMWVRDASAWKVVKELYVRDGGSWKYVIPIHGVSCLLAQGNSNGTCEAVNASYRIESVWFGPIPQNSGTDKYQIKHYERRASSAIAIFSAIWQLVGTFDLNALVFNQTPIFLPFVIGGSQEGNRRWQQAQARLVHTVTGEVPIASGGIVSATVRNFFIDDCDG